jgi:hypothetical protein
MHLTSLTDGPTSEAQLLSDRTVGSERQAEVKALKAEI